MINMDSQSNEIDPQTVHICQVLEFKIYSWLLDEEDVGCMKSVTPHVTWGLHLCFCHKDRACKSYYWMVWWTKGTLMIWLGDAASWWFDGQRVHSWFYLEMLLLGG